MHKHLTAALVFVGLTLVLTNPLLLHLWNAVEDKQDALLNTWILAWVGHALITSPLDLYNTNIFYPYHNTLAFSETLLPPSLFALPITLATNNPLFGYNLALLAMLWLDAFGMYLFVYDLTRRMEAGCIAGAIYAFNSFNLGNLAQLQLVTLGWLPLALLALRRMFAAGDRRTENQTQVAWGALCFILFFVLQALSSFYYALLAGFVIGLYLLWWLVTRRRSPGAAFWRVVLYPGASLICAALLLIPFLLPYFAVQRDLGFQRPLAESEPFSASLTQFVQVAPENWIYGRLLAPDPIVRLGGYPLDNLFPGVVVLALAIVGAVAKTHTREKWFLLALGLSAFVLALGPQLYLTSQVPTAVELPYRWLYEVFPPMRALRAPIRFDALINFALAALAGLGGVTLRRRLESFRGGSKGPRWLTASSTVVILGLIALEELALPAAHTVVLPVAGEIPPVYLWLARQAPGVVLELPMMGPNAQNELDISNQYFTTYHWHTTPDGYSGFIPPRRGEIAYEFRKPVISARGLALLQALDVSEVVLPPGWQSAATGKAQRLALLQDFGNVGVYSVPPAGDVKPNLFKQLYLPSSVAVGASFQAYMVLTNHNPTPYAVKPTVLAQAEVHWSNNRVEKVTFPIPLVTSSVSVVPIPMTAPQSPGLYELRVQGIDPVVGRMDAGGVVNVGTELAREVVIPASVKLGAPLAATSVRGATLPVALTWLPYNKIDEYYSASVRLVSTEGDKKSNTDREPAVKTLLWEPDVPVPDQFELKVPSDIPPGKYQIEVLMYQAETDQDVLLLDKEGKPQPVIVLGQIQVQ